MIDLTNGTTIYPTGTCFDDCLDHQDHLFRTNPTLANRQRIVHGICLQPEGLRKDEPFAHSWVEDDDEEAVYQSGIWQGEKVWFGVPRLDWYAAMRVQQHTRYTFREAMQLNWETNHFGPWREEYRALCGRHEGL